MLWFWGACGAFTFAAPPLGLILFAGDVKKRNAAIYAFLVCIVTGAICGQAFGQLVAMKLSNGIDINGAKIAIRLTDSGGATALGMGINVWRKLLVNRVSKLIGKEDAP